MKAQLLQKGTTRNIALGLGTTVVGGGWHDDLHIPGLPNAFAHLHVHGHRLVVESPHPLRVGRAYCPTGMKRLVAAGEEIALGKVAVLKPALREIACQPTRAVLDQLLKNPFRPARTCAPSLTFLTGLDLGKRVVLPTVTSELGRAASIRVRNRSVSRRHARLVPSGNEIWLENLGSPNGLYVNGIRVQKPRALKHGDVLGLGTALLRFSVPASDCCLQRRFTTEETRWRNLEWRVIGAGMLVALLGGGVAYALARF